MGSIATGVRTIGTPTTQGGRLDAFIGIRCTLFTIEGGSFVPTTSPGARKKGEIGDILTWVECFNSYTVVPLSSRTRLTSLHGVYYTSGQTIPGTV